MDDMIEVKIIKNGIELKDRSFVEPRTVEEGKKDLENKFQQSGFLQLGPLTLRSSRQLQKDTIYSYYFSETGAYCPMKLGSSSLVQPVSCPVQRFETKH